MITKSSIEGHLLILDQEFYITPCCINTPYDYVFPQTDCFSILFYLFIYGLQFLKGK